MIKQMLIFAAGLGIGVGGSYLYFRKKFNKDLEERINKELEPLNELYEKVNDEYMQLKHQKKYAPDESEDVQEGDAPKAKIFRKDNSEERKTIRYDVISKEDPAESEHPEDDPPEEDLDDYTKAGLEFEASRTAALRRRPERISLEDANEFPDFEQETWIYYPSEDVFTTEDYEPVYNADEILEDSIDFWRRDDKNVNDVCVVSHRLSTVYTIVKADGSLGHM